MRLRVLAIPLFAWALGSCLTPEQPTGLVLVADTDMGFLSGVSFHITGPDGRMQTADASMDAEHPPPFYVGMVRETAQLGPYVVTARAMFGERAMVSRRAEVWFSRGETLVVPLHLVWECHDRVCSTERPVCTERGCVAEALGRDQLEVWNGSPPRLEGRDIVDQDAITADGSSGDGAADGDQDEEPIDQDPIDQDPEPPDAGRDAGALDDGRDAGQDAGLDNGRD